MPCILDDRYSTVTKFIAFSALSAFFYGIKRGDVDFSCPIITGLHNFVAILHMADNRLFDKHCAKIIGVVRHRLSTDGDGVTTLVAFHGCPLRCRYLFFRPFSTTKSTFLPNIFLRLVENLWKSICAHSKKVGREGDLGEKMLKFAVETDYDR